LTAYKDNKKVEVRDPKSKLTLAGKEIRVYSQADFEKLSDSKKKENTETVTLCETRYYLSKRDVQWKKVHEDAKHEIRVRDNVSPGKYQVICPKEVAAPPPPAATEEKKEDPPAAKKKTPKKTATKKTRKHT
jgi:hypothetical protein